MLYVENIEKIVILLKYFLAKDTICRHMFI